MHIRNLRHVAITAALAAIAVTSRADALTTNTNPLALPTPSLATVQLTAVPEVQLLGTHYRPRSGGYRNSAGSASVSQIHVGFYDPDGDASQRFLMGIRGGPMLDKNIQLGVGVDWAHKTEKTATVTHTEPGPGGTVITRQDKASSASTNFFPMMAFVQVSADDNMPVVPYFGAAAGYEVLSLTADDFPTTGERYDATFGGWGWQLWGGAALPLSGRSRITGEVYVNGGEVNRDVEDTLSGGTYRETVNVDGMGLRLGLAWGF